MKDLDSLIDSIIMDRVLKSRTIIEAFENVDRADFVPDMFKESAYVDAPLGIGENQTISQPTTVAFMLEHLAPKKGDKILDIGAGSGWTTAILCHIVGEEGSVLGLERIGSLVELGKFNLARYCHDDRCRIEKAGDKLGVPGEKFDKILVSASADELPEELIDQLNIGGKLVIPVQNSIEVITKTSEDEYQRESIYGFVFVPLVY
ncbi:protein-L-isoaspartate O-methyltransferase [Sulfurovum sp. zt1-1]|uniref:Protein-L-isoaspartate O-methyltransferase n=1 Tax=Sulfurovum zhangzhouensis TaxID=3019067 RepID=A0ABT7QV46_9BACT|nr:protein-L-isoaspartate O-methyltransferase [Sulfurovum zhangzhouensis]MDM5270709.1 protein-L-isoaspartate O-methyltransferase [Sulfurovum zhangzhouensis]